MSRAQTSFALLLLPLLSIAACQRPAPERTAPTTDTVVFTGFTLIDGTGRPAAPNSAMTIEEGRIRWVGPVAELKAPAGATTVDLAGKFVMPGLINLHGHLGNVVGLTQDPTCYTRQTVEHDLQMYASYGVTTMLSLGIDKDLIFDVRAEQRKGPAHDGPGVHRWVGPGLQRRIRRRPVGAWHTDADHWIHERGGRRRG